MSFSPNINVWTVDRGANGKWKLQFTTDSLDEAAARFTALEAQGKQVYLYELGLFPHEGQQIAGQVAFWWSANQNEQMEGEPQGRGVGWSDGFNTYVEYIYPEPERAVLPSPWTAPASAPVVVSEPEERYAEAACDHCGRILPMNRLKRLTHEVRAGRTSGSTRTSRSTSSRFSGRSFSSGSSFGTSASSGRSYYKTETLVLCDGCYQKQSQDDSSVFKIIGRLLGL